jgi:hypothetical protein
LAKRREALLQPNELDFLLMLIEEKLRYFASRPGKDLNYRGFFISDMLTLKMKLLEQYRE